MLQESDEVVAIFLTGTIFTLLFFVFLLVYVYLHYRKTHEYNTKLREQELRKQQELFLALHEGEEKERKRLAEELHDGIGAKLSGLKMGVEYLQGAGLDMVVFENLKRGMNETIEELRAISQNLQPAFIYAKGLKNALHDLVGQLNTQNGCHYATYVQLDEEVLDGKFRLILFRMVSELLTNIHKHAHATEASVQVLQAGDQIQLIAEDNGRGFNESPGNGIGLINLRNRVELCKGQLTIDTGSKGTTVIVELPVIKSV